MLDRSSQKWLMAGSVLSLMIAGASPAVAKTAGASEKPVDTARISASADTGTANESFRPEAVSAVQRIRPFGAPITSSGGAKASAGRMRTFAGNVTGTAGRMRTFAGETEASAGRMRTFASELQSFAGRMRTFSADALFTTPGSGFWGASYAANGSVTASADRTRTFDTDFEAYAGRMRTFGGGPSSSFNVASDSYLALHAELVGLVSATRTNWGALIQAGTGTTFEQAFSQKLLTKWAIDLSDPRSLKGLNEVDLELFLLDWRDNLTLYSGVNSVDHWMKAVNWSPALTQSMTSGTDAPSKIGIIDFTIGDGVAGHLTQVPGVSNVSSGHGSAVASLIVGAHDGKGVMGFAPRSNLIAFNPFDFTMTAGWSDLRNGAVKLGSAGASVINMSLGVPGWALHPEWRSVLGDDEVRSKAKKAIFVIAAGNEGIVQTTNVNMKGAFDTMFLVVGSVDPDNVISGFSNQPGTTCLLNDRDCKNADIWSAGSDKFTTPEYLKESGLLMNRFLVAPGEFMLVDDGAGGVTRMSGTSFAAPLVSGAIALIQDRWPWLVEKPLDVADIILKTTTDLGAPGTDPVYGRGMLNVEAAMSPVDWNKVTYQYSAFGSGLTSTTLAATRSTSAAYRALWDASSAYFFVYERTANSFRDFYVPMSSKLVGQMPGSAKDQMNAYLTSRLGAVRGAPLSLADGNAGSYAFGPARLSAPNAGLGDLSATFFLIPRERQAGLRQSATPFGTGMTLRGPDGRMGVRFGSGQGGVEMDERSGFGLQSDYDVQTGGANPFLGLASGGGYISADFAITDRLTVAAGASSQTARRDLDQMSFQERLALQRLEHYRANASLLSLRFRANDWLRTSFDYTVLDESTGLLGVQSLDPADLRHGTTTDAATVGTNVTPGNGLAVSLSGTLGRTRADDLKRQNMGVAAGGLFSSAFQVAVSKEGLFDGRDRARVTFAQPLHAESGKLAVNQYKVVDRSTGTLGYEVEKFALLGGDRRFVGEAMYGRSVLDGAGEFSLFGRAHIQGDAADRSSVTVAAGFRLGL